MAGGANEFESKTPVHDQAAYLQAQMKAQEIAKENQDLKNARAQAPGSLVSGSKEYNQVKEEEGQAAAQAYQAGRFSQTGSTADNYSAARMAALKSGSFNYNAVKSAFYSPPSTFVNDKGSTVLRTDQQDIQPISQRTPIGSPGREGVLFISSDQLARSNTQRARLGLPPLQNVTNVQITDIKLNQSSKQAQPTIQSTIQPQVAIPGAISTNPSLRESILQTFTKDPSSLKYTGTDKGSYLYSLFQKGVLASSDFDYLNSLSNSYNAKVTTQNQEIRQQNIKASQAEIASLTSTLNIAKSSGATTVNIVNDKGQLLGSVSTNDIGQARLQSLKIISKAGGNAVLQYDVAKTTQQSGVTSSITSYAPANVLTALIGGFLGTSAEIGLIGLGGIAKLTGKDITIGNTTIKPTGVLAQAQEKTEKTFGQQTADQLLTGQKVDLSNPLAIASLVGSGAFLVASGGTGAIRSAIKAPFAIAEALRAPSIAKTIVSGLRESPLLSQVSRVKGSKTLFEFEQGTAGKSGVSTTKLEPPTIRVERLPSGQVSASSALQPKEVKLTAAAKEGEAEIPYAVIGATSKGTTAIVTKGITQLTPQEIAIKGLPPEVGKAMGLSPVSGTGKFPVFAGKLTSKNIPILMEEIGKGQITPTFDILKFYSKDFASYPTRYGQLSRETNLLSSNAFEKIARPSVMRYYEARVELEKEAIRPDLKGGTKPGGFTSGGSGKGKTVLSQEEKSIVQNLTKEKITKQSSGLKSDLAKTSTQTKAMLATGLVTKLKLSQRQGTIQIQKGKQETKQVKDVMRLVRPGEIKQTVRDRSGLTTIRPTKQDIKVTPKIIITPKQSTKQTPIQKQVQPLISRTSVPNNPGNGNELTPDTTKKPPAIFGALTGNKPGALGNVSKSGARKGYIGNVPLESIVGIYKRSEITYGSSAERLATKDRVKDKSNYNKLSSNKSRSYKI